MPETKSSAFRRKILASEDFSYDTYYIARAMKRKGGNGQSRKTGGGMTIGGVGAELA